MSQAALPVAPHGEAELAYTHAIVLDFEATCDDQEPITPQEIIEFPSVLVSLKSLEIVGEFQSFVRPGHHPVLTDFCKNLTSIRQTDVDAAAPFPEVFAKHQAWLAGQGLSEDNALCVTCGDWDLGTMLPSQCLNALPVVEAIPPVYTRWQNIKRAFCAVRRCKKAPGMAGMLKEFGVALSGRHHRGIDDCRNIARLYQELLQQDATAEITAELPISKYPPITVQLCFGDRSEVALLNKRNVKTLQRLAGLVFRRTFTAFRRQDGRPLLQDRDLQSLAAGEEIHLS